MQNKVAMVMGGGAGTGRATALAFTREGARVVVTDVNPEGAAETLRQIEALGGEGLAVECDMANAEDIAGAIDASNKAKTWTWVSFGSGFVVIILYVLMVAVAGAGGM